MEKFSKVVHHTTIPLSGTLLGDVGPQTVLVQIEHKNAFSYNKYNVQKRKSTVFLKPCEIRIHCCTPLTENTIICLTSPRKSSTFRTLKEYDLSGNHKRNINLHVFVSVMAVHEGKIIACDKGAIRVINAKSGKINTRGNLRLKIRHVNPLSSKTIILQGRQKLVAMKLLPRALSVVRRKTFLDKVITCTRGQNGFMYVTCLTSENALTLHGMTISNLIYFAKSFHIAAFTSDQRLLYRNMIRGPI